jgi:hypothetical protein
MIRIKTKLLTMIYTIAAASMIFPVAVMADATNTSKATETDYNACCQVLKSIIDGYDHNNAAAVQALFYFKPGTDLKTIDVSDRMLELDVAAYWLANASLSHFGLHGSMLLTGDSTDAQMFLDALSQIGLQNARIMGNTLTITPPAITGGSGWPQKPLYFARVENMWKFDAGRTFRLTFTAVRRQRIDGETPQQAFAAAIQLYSGLFNAIANDIEKGTIPDEAEAQRRVEAARGELIAQFRDFGCNTIPR